MKIIIPVASVLALFIILSIVRRILNYKAAQREETIERALGMILCCNSYDKMLDVYTTLDEGSAKYGIEIQYNCKGYF